MKRSIPLALIAGTLLMCVGAGTSQAAVLPGIGSGVTQAHATVTQVGWHRRHCWWRYHHRHCRYWRHRWY